MGARTSLTPTQIERFRTLLQEERATAEVRIADRSTRIPATVRQDDDPADRTDDASALLERERALIENEYDAELVRRIDRALARVDEGTYGLSEASGAPIPLERLEAVPWATTLPDEEPPGDG